MHTWTESRYYIDFVDLIMIRMRFLNERLILRRGRTST